MKKQTARRENAKVSVRSALNDGALSRLRAVDWSHSPLGNYDAWPSVLRVAATLCFNSLSPMFICGRRPYAAIYNDACARWLGGRPGDLGQPLKTLWPEYWNVFEPLLGSVFETGAAARADDVKFAGGADMTRQGVALSLTPIADDDGIVVGVMALLENAAPLDFSDSGVSSDIASAQQNEQALRRRDQDFRVLFEQAGVGVSMVDVASGRFLLVNPKLCELLGYTREELLERTFLDVTISEERERDAAGIGALARGEISVYEVEKRYVRNDGTIFWGALIVRLLPSDGDAPARILGLVRDISVRKRSEQALVESEERFRRLADTAPVLIWMTDENKQSVYFNKRWLEFTGESLEQALQSDWTQGVHPEDRRALERCAEAFHAHEPFALDFRLRRHDGEYRWMSDSALPRYDADGVFRGFIGSMADITERKQLEQENARMLQGERLARAEAELLRDLGAALNSEFDLSALLQRVTDVGTAAIGAEFGAFFYNAIDDDGESYQLYTLSGLSRDAFAKFPMPRNTAIFASTFNGVGVVRSDDITKDPRYGKSAPHYGMPAGHPTVVSYLAVPVKSRVGTVFGGLFFGHAEAGRFSERDERLVAGIAVQAAVAIDNARLFETVREQASRWQATYDTAAIGICEVDLNGRFIGSNEKFREIIGYTREELLRLKFRDLTHPDDIALSEAAFRELQEGKNPSYTLEKRYIRKDGNIIWARLTAALARDVNGNPHYGVTAIEDITDSRRAEMVILGQKKALEQIARDESLSTVLQTLVDTFHRQSVGDGYSHVLLLEPEHGLTSVASVGLAREWAEAMRRAGTATFAPASESVGDTLQVIDVDSHPRWESLRALAAKHNVRQVWVAPIRSAEHKMLGVFAIYYPERQAPGADDRRFLDIIVDSAAVAIDRYRAEKSLRLQAQVLSHIHDAVVMIDRQGVITRWNEGAARLFGHRAEDVIGQHVSVCYFPEDRGAIEEQIRHRLARDGRFELVMRLRRHSGEALHGHVSLSLLYDESGKRNAVVAYVIDMSERVRAEDEIRVRVRQQDMVAHLGQLALSGVELSDLMEQAVRGISATLEVEMVKVLELMPDGRGLRLCAGVGWRDGVVGNAVVNVGPESQGGYALEASTPLIVADLRNETRFRAAPLLSEHHVISGMSVIISGERDRPYGVLGAHSARQRDFSIHDINFLQSAANVLAAAIQRRHVEAMLAQARDELEQRVEERTAELARANQSLRDEIVDRMGVEGALRESEAQYRMLFERNPLSAWVFDINTRQIMAANETAVWQYGYTRDEFLRMTIDDLHPQDEGSRVLDYAEQFPPETAYIGVWKHRKQDETVIDVEIFVYEVLFQGRWARLVLANDITERRRAEQEFRLLETITRSVSEARGLEAALYEVVRHICETTGWAVGEAWLPSSALERIARRQAWHSTDPAFESFKDGDVQLELAVGEGLIGRAWAARHPVWVSDVAADAGFGRAAHAQAVGLRAGTAFPVVAEGEIVALLVFFLREPRREDERLVKLVSTIAAQLGLAIQRKRAEEMLRRSELQLSEAQHLAHLGSWEWDVSGGMVKWSDELYRIYGMQPGGDVTYEDFLAHVHPEDRERVKSELEQTLHSRAPLSGEERIVRPNGEVRHLLTQAAAVTDDADGGMRMVGVCLDITERKRAEERLRDYAHRLQSLSQRLLEAQEMERRRIARELHDQIGQDLSVIKINLQTIKRLPAAAVGSQVDETIRVVEGVLATARNLSLELRPSMLDDLGLAAALRWYLDRQSQRAGFNLQFNADNVDGRVAATIETACFRLAQEALTNIIRHAHAEHVRVDLELTSEALQMSIHDDGRGFDVEAARARAARGDSFGLLGMEERALLAGGTLEIISTVGKGATLTARFPLKATTYNS